MEIWKCLYPWSDCSEIEGELITKICELCEFSLSQADKKIAHLKLERDAMMHASA